MAVAVLNCADGREKTALSRKYAAQWQAARAAGETPEIGHATPPLRPARPEKPELLNPRDVPHRKPGSEAGRIAQAQAKPGAGWMVDVSPFGARPTTPAIRAPRAVPAGLAAGNEPTHGPCLLAARPYPWHTHRPSRRW